MAHGPTILGVLILSAASALTLAASTADTPADPPSSSAVRPGLTLEQYPPHGDAVRGREVYAQNCIGCHGPEGQGDGPAARWLNPIPRNFQQANFKFRSTPSGELPLLADVVHVVTCGLAGSSMPAFPLMAEGDRKAVAAWVLHLAEYGMLRGEVDYRLDDGDALEKILGDDWQEILDETLGDAYEDVWPVEVPQEPENDADSVAHGAELYRAQCVACHGAGGRGDGPSSYALRDWKDAEVVPRDFTTGVFRAGSTPRDLFMRMKTGLNGTPMPQISGSDDDLWALVHFIVSLQDPDTKEAPHPLSCAAHAKDAAR
ncbi:MAG: c-type cytochrome [Planctomycetes bacterium]|nr:c-type cytochrome [Planctomycetota bacterium]